jgi:PadR family transcriptional regulator PadR
MTLQTQLVLEAMLTEPTAQRYGLQLCQETGLPSGTIYPIVARLEDYGWLESSLEDQAHASTRGRPRRYYRLTGEGVEQARDALARVRSSRKQPRPRFDIIARPGIQGGSA